ncbi:hypothetical protein Z517_05763 [Fonsecaea pedrosoi CBS 271.37]|uniref:EthD domain-containing protein n=1 Tax=Fonsecaea pedrosoi CBS 271.37 TaxID=1442368 RepID=A0A0D2DN75_9EURO|nr:uncharacterized protein Z517_05763 [Fonsecaea pedrosoi CBS 271.37]KIW79151.1 hypothetical protein Z517_05763 [Fonsecaea pedrosoi CBS 271.37]
MIKLVYVIERRPDMPEKAFYDYWLNKHGPLVRRHAKAIRAKKYVQSHLIETPINEALRSARNMLGPVAGITEVWWDSVEDFQAGLSTPDGQAAAAELSADEDKFIDVKKSRVFMTKEHVIFDYTDKKPLGGQAIKCTYLLTRRDNLSQEACHKTWLEDHGPFVNQFADVSNMAKYIQSHTIAPELNASIGKGRGLAAPLDGITEVWFDDPGKSQATEEAQKADEAMVKDERRFVDMGRSHCFITKEYVIFDYSNSVSSAAL